MHHEIAHNFSGRMNTQEINIYLKAQRLQTSTLMKALCLRTGMSEEQLIAKFKLHDNYWYANGEEAVELGWVGAIVENIEYQK